MDAHSPVGAHLRQCPLELLLRAPVHKHVGSTAGEPLGCGLTQAVGGPRDQDRLLVERPHAASQLFVTLQAVPHAQTSVQLVPSSDVS